VSVTQPCRLTRSVVGIALLDICFVRRDERSGADEPMGMVEDGALLGRRDRNVSRTSPFGPRAFELDPVASVCIARLELDALFAPQTEGLLQ